MTLAKYFYLNFIRKEKISKDVFAFYFKRKNIDFLAGQYIHIYLPVVNEKGRGNSRMFTIASSPLEKDYIFVAVKKGKSLFKKSLFKLKPQTSVKFYGPSGGLIIDENPPTGGNPSYVFLALGIGITPFRSIIKYINQKNIKVSVTIFASFSKKGEMVFLSELLAISKSNPDIKVIYTSNRINEALIKKHVKNINEHLYYIAGPASGVLDLEDVVSEMGVPNDKIFIEDFEGY